MEPEQLGAWIDRLSGPLVLFARQWTDAPEDAVQDAFIALSAQTPAPDDPAAWLFRTVRNRAVNAGIAGRRRVRREREAAARTPPWFVPDSAAAAGPAIDPESARDALARLPDRQREVIVAHLWGGLTFDQVAAVVGGSGSSAHRIYHAGLHSLREFLGVAPPCPPNRSTPN